MVLRAPTAEIAAAIVQRFPLAPFVDIEIVPLASPSPSPAS